MRGMVAPCHWPLSIGHSWLRDSISSVITPGFQVSAQPPAKRTAGQIEKETEVSYEVSGFRIFHIDLYLLAAGLCMLFVYIILKRDYLFVKTRR
jgi:hypothetical protein